MNFFQFLKSLDDLLYEVVSWLVFYPVTLWRTLREPLTMMDYATSELTKPDEQQFDEALSPPILLMLTVLVAHGFELALIGESAIVAEKRGVAGLISDDTSLILLRVVAFASFPLIFAVHTLRKQRVRLTRQSLEPAFFAQCYANAPFALIVSFAATLTQVANVWAASASLALLGSSAIGFVAVETMWFRKILGVGVLRGIWNAVAAYGAAIAFMIAVAWLVGGEPL